MMTGWRKPEVRPTPELLRLVRLMLASPQRRWTADELKTALDEPVARMIADLLGQGLLHTGGYVAETHGPRFYVAPGQPYGLTSLGRQVFEELAETTRQEQSLQQRKKAARFVRDLVASLPEEMADRILLTGSNVVQIVTDSGEAYTLTVTPH